MAHTPGPWALPTYGAAGSRGARNHPRRVHDFTDDRGNGDPIGYSEANAKLIAAAPDLLAVCEMVLSWVNDPEASYLPMVDAARAVVEKAAKSC
jgi:hypothetical protein